jgi:hypothetical protein
VTANAAPTPSNAAAASTETRSANRRVTDRQR